MTITAANNYLRSKMVTSFTPTPPPEESQLSINVQDWFSFGKLKATFLRKEVFALIASFIVATILALWLLTPAQQPIQPVSPELIRLQQIQQANYNVSLISKNQAVENFTLNTAGMTPGSGVAEQTSDLQAAMNNAVVSYKQRIAKQLTDKNSTYYGKHEAIAHKGASVLTAKIALAASEGSGISVTFKDPETGKAETMEFSADEALIMAMIRNQISALAQSNAVVKETPRTDITRGVWEKITQMQTAVKQLLELQGYDQITTELEKTDIFGRPMVAPTLSPNEIPSPQPLTAPSVEPQSYSPSSKPQNNKPQQVSLVIQAHPGY